MCLIFHYLSSYQKTQNPQKSWRSTIAILIKASTSDVRLKWWGKKDSLTCHVQSCTQSWMFLKQLKETPLPQRFSVLTLSQPPACSQPKPIPCLYAYFWKSGNIHLCKGQALKILSIKHYIRMSPDCMMLTGAGLNTKTLMPSSAESLNEVLCHLPDLCQVIKLFCMYGTALCCLWRLSMPGREVHIDWCIQEHAQILIAFGSFGLSLRKINLFSLSRFVVSCKNRCWTEVMIIFFSCECLTEVL